MTSIGLLRDTLIGLHEHIRASVLEACERQEVDFLACADEDDEIDTIYQIDRVSERKIIAGLEEVARTEPVCLIAEGIKGGKVTIPEATPEADCVWRIIFDPIDGTRGLMYQKRSAWILTGVAPNTSDIGRLSDIIFAIQTEIPVLKQNLSDQLWVSRGHPVEARRYDRITERYFHLRVLPSQKPDLDHGFVTFCRFFPGARDVISTVDDEVVLAVTGPHLPGKALCFEDQYACTGGQLYELMNGHDRMVADLRPLLQTVRKHRNLPAGLCAHPYDLCTVLIAESLGVFIRDPFGRPLDAPLSVEGDVAWVGYANDQIRTLVEPVLLHTLREKGL